jgi:chemotaxis protein methyltransferase CheR
MNGILDYFPERRKMFNQRNSSNNTIATRHLGDREFKQFSEFIEAQCGIKMPATKKTMLESRLQKRLRSLELESFRVYCDYLFSPEGMKNELIHMIDVVTTNKTDFFREPIHFNFLNKNILAKIGASGNPRKFRVWSAGCSSGEEPYTLAMVLNNFAEENSGFCYSILATDICTTVLQKAASGIYHDEDITPIPLELKRKYLLKSKDRSKGMVRIVPELRRMVKFRRLNFMDSEFGITEPMDVIFCRNVMIYFDRETQEKLLNKFCRHLAPDGHLFLGHSETLNGLDVPLVQVYSTVYRKQR